MATTNSAVKPLVSRGYDKIVGLTVIAIVVGCALMGFEIYGEYGGDMAPKRVAAPKIGSLLPAEKGAPAPAPPPPGPMGN